MTTIPFHLNLKFANNKISPTYTTGVFKYQSGKLCYLTWLYLLQME